MKYNWGDRVDDNERYRFCPECGEPVTSLAKRPQMDSRDARGHEWHINLKTMTVERGPG